MSQPTGAGQSRLEELWRQGGGSPPAGELGVATRRIPVDEYPGYSGYPGGPDGPDEREPLGTSSLPVRPVRRRFGPMAIELLIAMVVSTGTAIGMTWTVARRLGQVVPGAGGDAFPELWSLGWSGHALEPGSGIPLREVLDGNTFYPVAHSFALADQLFGYGPLSWFFSGPTGLVTAYDVLFVATGALASLGGYALARQLGAHPVAAAVAGAGLAYAPWRAGQLDQLHLLAVGPIAIALAMLARGHGLTMSGRRARPRPFWALLGWGVAAWQLTVGIDVNLPFAGLLAVIAVLALVVAPFRMFATARRRRRDTDPYADPYAEPYADLESGDDAESRPSAPRRALLVLADVVGVGLFAAVGAGMLYPLARLQSIDPQAVAAARSLDAVRAASPEPLGLITPPTANGVWSTLADTHSLVSGGNEVRLLPGVVLLELAVLGLVLSTWRWWWRVLLLLVAAAFAGLTLGTNFPAWFPGPVGPFELLRRHVPLFDSLVQPGRLIVFVTLAVCLLAAGGVSRLTGRDQTVRGRPTFQRTAMLAVLLLLPALVVAEGWTRLPVTPVPAVPAALAQAQGPLIVLPSSTVTDGRAMFWSAERGFPPIGNGAGPVVPSSLQRLRQAMAGFPDTASVAYLRKNGFRSVVVLKDPAEAPPQDPTALGLAATQFADSTLYTLAAVG